MEDSKVWYQSTSILGSVVTLIALIASIFNYTIDAQTQGQIVSIVIAIFGGIGSIYAIVGRVKATKVIAPKTQLPIVTPDTVTAPTIASEHVAVVGDTITQPMPFATIQPILSDASQAFNKVIQDSVQVLTSQIK